MALGDNDSKQPIRGVAADLTTKLADSSNVTINPAKEDGNLATLAGWDSSGRAKVDIQTNAAINNAQVAGTATSVNTGNADAGTQRVVLASDQPTVAVDGPAAGLGVDVEKIAGTAATVNTGNAGAGTLRVVLASDQPVVAVDGPAAGLGVDLEKIAGTATDVNTGNASNGTQRVVIASDQPAIPVTPGAPAGGDVLSYKISAATIATGATDTNTYSPGSTKIVTGVLAGASGQCRVDVKWGTTGSEAFKLTFYTSKGDLSKNYNFPTPITLTNTQSILVIVENMDNQSQKVTSSIWGY